MAWTVAVLITVAAVAVGPLDAKEIEDRQSYNYTDDLLFMNNELNEAHHFFSNKTGQIIPRKGGSKCKAKDVCIIMGGSCVTNATLCGGRLVPGCKGKNCQCCVAGSLEAKINSLEQMLQNMQVNITDGNRNLNMELQTLRDNLTDANMQLSKDLLSMGDNFNNSISNIGTKLDSIRCSKDMFLFSTQCFKWFDTSISWSSAKTKCQNEGLVLAKPNDPLPLMKYLYTRYNDGSFTWLDARGTGSSLKWQRDGLSISNSDPRWWTGHPTGKTSSSYCLLLNTNSNAINKPNHSYYSRNCSTASYNTLCELVLG